MLRLVLGAVMIAHGYPKIFGGFSHFAQLVSSLGMPAWLAYFAAVAEFLGGIAVIVGLLTRLAALGIVIDLSLAIAKVHFKNGFTGNGNYQLPWRLAAMRNFRPDLFRRRVRLRSTASAALVGQKRKRRTENS